MLEIHGETHELHNHIQTVHVKVLPCYSLKWMNYTFAYIVSNITDTKLYPIVSLADVCMLSW